MRGRVRTQEEMGCPRGHCARDSSKEWAARSRAISPGHTWAEMDRAQTAAEVCLGGTALARRSALTCRVVEEHGAAAGHATLAVGRCAIVASRRGARSRAPHVALPWLRTRLAPSGSSACPVCPPSRAWAGRVRQRWESPPLARLRVPARWQAC
eukprot:8871307-Pyramimonas_sp.AAC.1